MTTTKSPIALINPVGSTAGNFLKSTGPSTPPQWSSTVDATSLNGKTFASPADIGTGTPANGTFLVVTASGLIVPASAVGIKGTTTNDNAQAGSWGEYQAGNGGAVSLTSNATSNLISLNLTAGDWDVSGTVQFIPTSVTSASSFLVGITTTSATMPTAVGQLFALQFAMSSPAPSHFSTPVFRFSLASTTQVYLVANSTWTGGTMSANSSIIRARRVR